MDKSPDAFRTISEVAEMLGTPAHVLRFWESRFPQIRPVKRAGGRRYYRPADVMLLTGIKTLLHDQGMTIRGVQKILREQGVRQVAALSGGELPEIRAEESAADLEQALAQSFGVDLAEVEIEVEPESATIIALETALRQPNRPAPAEETDLPPALAAADDDQALDLPPEEANLFSLLDDDPGPDNLPEPVTPKAELADAEMAMQTPESGADFVADTTAPDIAPKAATEATRIDPLEIARRLRQVKPEQLAVKSGQLAALQQRLRGLHASLGPVQPAPIAPQP